MGKTRNSGRGAAFKKTAQAGASKSAVRKVGKGGKTGAASKSAAKKVRKGGQAGAAPKPAAKKGGKRVARLPAGGRRRAETGRSAGGKRARASTARQDEFDVTFEAQLTVSERLAGGLDSVQGACRVSETGSGGQAAPRAVKRAADKLAARASMSDLADMLSALASHHRLKMLVHLLGSSAGYADLRAATGLAAGPLYHHVHQLRLAGLIAPKSRDCYQLTRGGRNALLGAMALAKVAGDRRLRAAPRPAKPRAKPGRPVNRRPKGTLRRR